MNLQEIDNRKKILLNDAKILSAKQKKLYGNIDISQPISEQERELSNQISSIFSEINQLVKLKRQICTN